MSARAVRGGGTHHAEVATLNIGYLLLRPRIRQNELVGIVCLYHARSNRLRSHVLL